MSDLRQRIADIQRHVGVEADGIFGPVSAGAVLAALNACEPGGEEDAREDPLGGTPGDLDARTAKTIGTLDEKARPAFARFARLAAATAASMGCDYRAISGFRSWKEQEELYAKGRTTAGMKVTNARAGYSWHNFGVAADFGVFRGRIYVDVDEPDLADRVHAACAAHAEGCGLAWGGDWGRFPDTPHYQIGRLPASPGAEHRKTYQERGSVL